ncbi:SDR family oxidoreductase [Streptomyces sp. NPDC005202]|uniref:SDR family NAD(P)-dependent oxidoreductase n=1 Tax=Streptomyces sp. NPDC005202 TaxID=3157021 RepID=UPI0033AFDDCC
MTNCFSGRTALVTGAGSGIGRAVALAFAREGANVVVAGRTAGPLEEVATEIEGLGGKALAVTADVSRAAETQALVTAAVDRFGPLDVAVNNAGVRQAPRRPGGARLADPPRHQRHRRLPTLQAEIRQMRTQPAGGAIVNVSSNLGIHSHRPGVAAYAASKAAVTALTRSAALDHIADGVRINTVSPGPTATAMSRRPGETEAQRAARVGNELPLGRVSATEEVAAAVLYLASDEAAPVVGTDLLIDSGASL